MFGVCGSFFIASGVVVLPILCISKKSKEKEAAAAEENGHELSIRKRTGSSAYSLGSKAPKGSNQSLQKFSDE